MPFKSEKQRRYLFANEPELAKKWSNMYGKKIIGLGSLTKKEMMEIIKKGEISKLSKKDKKQLFEFAFGKSYMKSSDKGKKKKYKEIKRITGLGGVDDLYKGKYRYYKNKSKDYVSGEIAHIERSIRAFKKESSDYAKEIVKDYSKHLNKLWKIFYSK